MLWQALSVLLLAGGAVGFITGLFSSGGGIIIVTTLLAILPTMGTPESLTMKVAVATSIFTGIPTLGIIVWRHIKEGNLDLPYFRSMPAPLILGTLCAVGAVGFLPVLVLKWMFVSFLLLSALYLPFQTRLTLNGGPPHGLAKMLLAFVAAAFSSCVGAAAGSILTPVFLAYDYPYPKTVAISSAAAFITVTLATAGYIISGLGTPGLPAGNIGYVNLTAGISMLPLMLYLAPIGVKVGMKLDRRLLNLAFATLLCIIAAKMIYRLMI